MKILVIGANGMLGNACMHYFSNKPNFDVIGSVRSKDSRNIFPSHIKEKIIHGVDIVDTQQRDAIFKKTLPDVVINCVGLVKQAQGASNAYQSILLNSLLPHQLAERCQTSNAKLVHLSTDCVFSGLKGSSYLESDIPDATDLYGRTKYLGEVAEDHNALTLRTSYIGNELMGSNGLLEWFLSQEGECLGFTRAIYSGLPTVILMGVIEDILLKHPYLNGMYHLASEPISKYNLLRLIADAFSKKIRIIPNDKIVIDRTLDGSRFQNATGFMAPPWDVMVEKMYIDRLSNV